MFWYADNYDNLTDTQISRWHHPATSGAFALLKSVSKTGDGEQREREREIISWYDKLQPKTYRTLCLSAHHRAACLGYLVMVNQKVSLLETLTWVAKHNAVMC